MESSSRSIVGSDRSETASSRGLSKGDRPTKRARELARAIDILRLLWREVDMKLGGAALCGRYGGGGSAKLLLSANGSARLCEFDVIDTISEVSIPVR